MSEHLLIRELAPHEVREAADLTARGMHQNPMNIAAFGKNSARRADRMQAMFRIALPMIQRKGVVVGAFNGPTLVGIAASVPSTGCQPSSGEKLILTPRMFRAVGPLGFARMLRWTRAWAARDDALPHWHLGPVAIDAHLQGRGLGSALMTEYCERLDQAKAVAYLETDKEQNTRFYIRFGFRVVGEAIVLKIPNWFMRRTSLDDRSY